jgi:hypothetical protein
MDTKTFNRGEGMKRIFAFFVIGVCFFGCASFAQLLDSGSGRGSNNGSRTGSGSGGSRVKSPRPPMETEAKTKTGTELIAEAVKWGDCAFLYAYTQKEDADKNLVSQANNAIKQYTSIATNTANYRTDKMDARVRRVPKELMEQIFETPASALPNVISSLTNGISDQFLKTKVLHDWICDNIAYDAEMYFSGRITAQDYVSVLKKKKAVCSGYTNLMNEMCRIAGIESIGINGYSKGIGYTGKIGPNTDHAWNAVHIGNKWYLIDVTWDAGPLDRRVFIKRYSTGWLFLDSRPFLYSHLPEEDAYQFYAPILTADDFMREAYIAGKFFQYGLSLKAEDPEYNNVVNGGMTFDIILRNNNVSVSSQLRTPNNQNINAASWAERKGSTITFDFDVPDTNQYKGNVFARYTNVEQAQDKIDIRTYESDWLPRAEALFVKDKPKESKITERELEYFKNSFYKVADNGYYYMYEDQFDTPRNTAVLKIQKLLDISVTMLENVLNFNIKAVSGYQGFGQDVLKYPYTFSTYNELSNTQLVSPKSGTLKAGSSETFAISSTNYSSFAIIINGQWNFFTKDSKTGNFELTFTVPTDVDSIKISGSTSKTGTHWGLAQYNVVP